MRNDTNRGADQQQTEVVNPKEQFNELGRNVSDRRRSQRAILRSIIRVAEWDGSRFPSPSEFREVETRDLATNGISFFDAQAPRSESLILMLGDWHNPIYVIARVAHHQECLWSKDRQWFVGCEFVGRVPK